ncbi:spindle pole body component alp6 [Phakopsora pachyrhizi]|nr:spindle pole body component alp6 [Phakopsora pachyrhizi]
MSNRKSEHLVELIRRLTDDKGAIDDHLIRSTRELLKNQQQSSSTSPSIRVISDQILHHLNSHPSYPSESSQSFNSLLSRLVSLQHPRLKSETLSFLLCLAPSFNEQNHHHHLNTGLRQLQPSTTNVTGKPDQQQQQQRQKPSSISLPDERDSLADRLRHYRLQNGLQIQVPETELLRDMIYLLQGIDGRFVHFKPKAVTAEDESFEEGGIGFNQPADGKGQITLPQRDLILKLTELGWLYKKIESAIDKTDSETGVVEQAFGYALKEELGSYYRSVAVIESHLSSPSSNAQLTLKSLLLHLTPTVLRLRMSATLIAAVKGMKGGQLISVLHSYTDHGDPVVNLFTSNLLEKVSVPWFKTLVSWMWDGELVDPMDEFFIQLNPGFENDQVGNQAQDPNLDGWSVWRNKFSFRTEMVPSFISEVFARKIFSTGKSLNFIKHACGDDEWQRTRSRLHQSSPKPLLHYKDITGLQKTIQSTYKIATERLFHIFFIKLRLLDHLKAIKDYLLLGRGDFIGLLIETLGPSLNKPANTLYRHNLTATLESAIRSTSNETGLINRLDVRMLEFSSMELGWEVFMLEYKSERPLDVVISSSSMEKYMKMFRMLWKMKRVEYVLDMGWRVIMIGASRSLRHLRSIQADFHRARLMMSEMIHFIRQLQCYCHLEVIDCGWQEFEKKLMSEGGDLDSLIEGHTAYLDRLVNKGMLVSHKVGRENACLLLAEECFKTILSFKGSIDALYAFALSKSIKKINKDSDSEVELEDERDTEEDSERLETIRNRIHQQSKLFTDLVLDMISTLSTQQDPEMKFLAVRLNFSLFYMRPKLPSNSSNHHHHLQQQQQLQQQQENLKRRKSSKELT